MGHPPYSNRGGSLVGSPLSLLLHFPDMRVYYPLRSLRMGLGCLVYYFPRGSCFVFYFDLPEYLEYHEYHEYLECLEYLGEYLEYLGKYLECLGEYLGFRGPSLLIWTLSVPLGRY